MEYISLGCDILPILHGRSPIQAYADLMRSFRETFRSFLGGVITVRLTMSCYIDSLSCMFSCCMQKNMLVIVIPILVSRGFKLD